LNKLAKSLSYAVIAQVISLFVSIFMSFFVSRFMPVAEFGYYQLFLFYSTYVGLFQLGVSEGVYLENGGNTLDQLKHEELKQLFLNTLLIETILVLALYCTINAVTKDENKKNVILFIAFYALTNLFVMFFGLLLQAVNLTEKYSRAVVVGKLFTLMLFFCLVIAKVFSYTWYCLVFLLGYMATGLIVCIDCKDILKRKIKPKLVIIKRYKTVIAGASLLLSGLISSFIIGINRIYIEQFFGIEVFAKVSMALSLCNFVILFAIQVGMVMFPNIVLLDDSRQSQLYKKLNKYSSLLQPVFFIGYIPLKLILSFWIPQYTESIRWMLLFVPYMIYEVKTQIMYNTYLKALRKEKTLFIINFVALIICGAINYIVILISHSMILMFWVIDLVMIVKSFLLSRMIEKRYGIDLSMKMVTEAVCCCASSYMVYSYFGVATVAAIVIMYGTYFIVFEKGAK